MIRGSVRAPFEHQLLSLATTWLLCQLYLVGGRVVGWHGQKPELVFTQIGQLDVDAEIRLLWRDRELSKVRVQDGRRAL